MHGLEKCWLVVDVKIANAQLSVHAAAPGVTISTVAQSYAVGGAHPNIHDALSFQPNDEFRLLVVVGDRPFQSVGRTLLLGIASNIQVVVAVIAKRRRPPKPTDAYTFLVGKRLSAPGLSILFRRRSDVTLWARATASPRVGVAVLAQSHGNVVAAHDTSDAF